MPEMRLNLSKETNRKILLVQADKGFKDKREAALFMIKSYSIKIVK